jgi:hypothetical protein
VRYLLEDMLWIFLGYFLVKFYATRVCAWLNIGEASCNFISLLNAYGMFYLSILKVHCLFKTLGEEHKVFTTLSLSLDYFIH